MVAHKMLVVDDEKDICEFVKNFFTDRGYNVSVAASGEDALAIVKAESPELVLLDVRMRGMDGIATLKHIKEHDRNIKVIMVTALDDQERMDESSRLGACGYITKPLTLDHLEETVEKCLAVPI